jgi:hypothetical protein
MERTLDEERIEEAELQRLLLEETREEAMKKTIQHSYNKKCEERNSPCWAAY